MRRLRNKMPLSIAHPGNDEGGCGSTVAVGALASVTVLGAALLLKKKKENNGLAVAGIIISSIALVITVVVMIIYIVAIVSHPEAFRTSYYYKLYH